MATQVKPLIVVSFKVIAGVAVTYCPAFHSSTYFLSVKWLWLVEILELFLSTPSIVDRGEGVLSATRPGGTPIGSGIWEDEQN